MIEILFREREEYVPLDKEYVQQIREFTEKKNDMPMIVDEVQTGSGRSTPALCIYEL